MGIAVTTQGISPTLVGDVKKNVAGHEESLVEAIPSMGKKQLNVQAFRSLNLPMNLLRDRCRVLLTSTLPD